MIDCTNPLEQTKSGPRLALGHGIQESRLLEPLCILWVKYGLITSGWNHAFKMLRKA